MATNLRISDLQNAFPDSLESGDLIPIARAGETRKLIGLNIKNSILGTIPTDLANLTTKVSNLSAKDSSTIDLSFSNSVYSLSANVINSSINTQHLTNLGVTNDKIANTTIAPTKLSTGAPSWTNTGLTTIQNTLTINRSDSNQEGGEIRLARAVDNAVGWHIDTFGTTTTPSLRIFDGSTQTVRVFIDGSNGFVNLGSNAAPESQLTVTGSYTAGNGPNISLINTSNNSTNAFGPLIRFYSGRFGEVPFAVGVRQNESRFIIARANSPFTEFLTINSSGNVGIGTTTPTQTLDVRGNIIATDGTNSVITANDGRIEIQRTAGDGYIDFKSGTAEDYDCRIQQTSNGLGFITGGNGATSEYLRITSSGFVGIGTTSPTTRLQVDGTVTATTFAGSFSGGNIVIGSGGNIVVGKTVANSRLNIAASDNTVTNYPLRIDNLSNNYGTGYGAYGLSNRENSTNLSVDYTVDIGRTLYIKTDTVERIGVYNNGNISIGRGGVANVNIRVNNNITGSTSAYSVFLDQDVSPDVTANAVGIYTFLGTSSNNGIPYTINTLTHLRIDQSGFHPDSTVTTQYGVYIDSGFTGGTNNYAFRSDIPAGTGRWNFYAGGTANNYFAGNVGIGTTAPNAPLHVIGEGQFLGNVRIQTAVNTGAISQDMSGLRLTMGNTNTTTAQFTPAILFGSDDSNFTTRPKYNALIVGQASETYSSDTDAGMNILFYTAANNSGSTGPIERLRITHDGNVGIGTTAPVSKLNIGGETSQYPNSITISETAHTTSRRAAIMLGTWLVGQDVNGNGTKDFFIWDGSVTRFYIQNTTGNIGIGTTAPSTALQVNGTVTATAFSGPLTGNVTGNLTGNVTGNLTGTASAIADNTVTSGKIVDGTIVNADINNNAAIALSKLATGALPTGITVNSSNIVNDTIVNADINNNAAIALSKLATGALPTGITVNSSNIENGSVANADLAFDGGSLGFRNKIINGDMQISQRGSTFSSITSPQSPYTLDRWRVNNTTTTGVVTVSQDTNVPTTTKEFGYSLKCQVTTADTSLLTTEYLTIWQNIEGYNVRDLIGNTFTLSFWVRSSKTGTRSVAFRNGDTTPNFDASYIAEYTINAANTWEYKTITVNGGINNSIGSYWNFTNGGGLSVLFTIARGTTYSTSTLNTWQNSNFIASSNAVNVLDTVGNTFYITGVQLERGPVATPFEQRPIGIELDLCQRYYQSEDARYHVFPAGPYSEASHDTRITPMRTAPTVTINILASRRLGTYGSPLISGTSEKIAFRADHDAQTTTSGYVEYSWTASAEL